MKRQRLKWWCLGITALAQQQYSPRPSTYRPWPSHNCPSPSHNFPCPSHNCACPPASDYLLAAYLALLFHKLAKIEICQGLYRSDKIWWSPDHRSILFDWIWKFLLAIISLQANLDRLSKDQEEHRKSLAEEKSKAEQLTIEKEDAQAKWKEEKVSGRSRRVVLSDLARYIKKWTRSLQWWSN